jgi:hypothetical protein
MEHGSNTDKANASIRVQSVFHPWLIEREKPNCANRQMTEKAIEAFAYLANSRDFSNCSIA